MDYDEIIILIINAKHRVLDVCVCVCLTLHSYLSLEIFLHLLAHLPTHSVAVLCSNAVSQTYIVLLY